MALFQKSVLKSYLEKLDEDLIKQSWETYQSYFLDTAKQKIIFEKKEEELQYEFLLQLFDKCLGYQIGVGNQNLFVEQKNVSDGGKADGAIKIDNDIVCVIELKSTKTKNLKDVEKQAFGYKVNHPNCKYVVTSNFNKLRFYIENTTEFEEFDLFNLTNDRFKLLWLYLSYDSISSNKPLKINKESLVSEEKITKELYKDYSEFRLKLFSDLKENNPQVTPEILLQKTQKLLDRMLFILFCEDRGLLPSNSITEIINYWDKQNEFGDDETLYDTYVTYFNIINKGRPQRGDKQAIYAYNGGLFLEDEVLNSLVISDNILLEYSKKLTAYDFDSEVSVNILGHIFEHSLTEIEELQNEIDGIEVDKSKSKRKKEGVYYTPQYITKYIIENTVGKLCEEKKIELKINEGEYLKGRKGRPKKKLQSLIDLLSNYRNWLLQITICDPACGSGAFLNQALEFLITEHQYIDELQSSLLEEQIQFSEVENSILENNLYGVDINRESVEIAKLSLWLRTAQKGRKLTSLNSNIKCGNSLIDDPEVAGDNAFNWQKEFPDVFAKGGFDVVIGNPPYVQLSKLEITTDEEKKYLIDRYKTSAGRLNTYVLFIHLLEFISKDNCLSGYIIPNTILTQEYYEFTRKTIVEKLNLLKVVIYPYMPFSEAVVENVTLFFVKNNNIENINIIEQTEALTRSLKTIKKSSISNANKFSIEINTDEIIDKIDDLSYYPLDDFVEINQAIALKGDKTLSVKSEFSPSYYKLIDGKHIQRNIINWGGDYLEYNIRRIHSCKRKDIFESSEKLFFRRVSSTLVFAYDNSQYFALNTLIAVNLKKSSKISIKYLNAILNSKLLNYYYSKKYKSTKKVFSEIQARTVKLLPILVSENTKNYEFLIEKILDLNKEFYSEREKFTKYLLSQFSIEKLAKKLQNWNELDFGDFINEINKAIKKAGGDKLDDKAQFSLMPLFEEQQEKAQTLKAEIEKTDKEIDQMVYKLYDLTKEEIEIVERASKT